LDTKRQCHSCLALLYSFWQVGILIEFVWLVEQFADRLNRHRSCGCTLASVETRYALHVAAVCVDLAALSVTYIFSNISRNEGCRVDDYRRTTDTRNLSIGPHRNRSYISHPGVQPHYQTLARDTFGMEGHAEPSAKIKLKPGLTISGTVADEAGQFIEEASVRTNFLNDLREAKTNAQGAHRLAGCDARVTRIVLSAKGMATDLQTVRVDPEMKPVNFHMQPGAT